MSAQTVAFRYAKSLISLAKEQNSLDVVYQDMKLFAQVGEENREFVSILKNPLIKHFKKLQILEALFKTRVSALTFSIFKIITEKNREVILPTLAEEFQHQYEKSQGIERVRVTSAIPLVESQKQQILEKISSLLQNKKLILEEQINPSLIGGYVLKIGDRQLDESIRRSLNDIKTQLIMN